MVQHWCYGFVEKQKEEKQNVVHQTHIPNANEPYINGYIQWSITVLENKSTACFMKTPNRFFFLYVDTINRETAIFHQEALIDLTFKAVMMQKKLEQ